MFFFFFKQKTAYEMRISDWSSDVCSSDLDPARRRAARDRHRQRHDRRRSRPRASAMAGRYRALGRRAQHRRVRRPARPGLRSCPDPPPSPERLSRVLTLAEYRHRSDRLADHLPLAALVAPRLEEHTSELQSLMHISYA